MMVRAKEARNTMSKKNWHDSGCVRDVYNIALGNYDTDHAVRVKTTSRGSTIRRTDEGGEVRRDKVRARPSQTRPMTAAERESLGLR